MAIKTARQIWQGNPVTADHQPSPSEIVAYMEVLQAVAAGGIATWRDTKADLDGVSAADGDIGFVLDDPTPALSGIYQSDGTSWTKIAEVPPGFAGLTVGQISNDKLADMISARLKGRASPGAGAPEDLSAEQIMAAFGLASAADLMALMAAGRLSSRDGDIFSIEDEDGNVALRIDRTALVSVAAISAGGAQLIPGGDDWQFYIGDSDGNILLGVDAEGTLRGNLASADYVPGTAQRVELVFVEGWRDACADAAVSWVSDIATGLVEYRLVGAADWRAAASQRIRAWPNLSGKHLHTALLEGLSAGARYELRWPGSAMRETFATAPRAGVRVAMASDHQSTDYSATGTAGLLGGVVTGEACDLLLLNGDYVNDDGRFTETYGQRWFDFLTQVARDFRTGDGDLMPMILTTGNHEGRNAADTSNAQWGGTGTIGMIETISSWGYDPEQPNRARNSAATLAVGLELFVITLETDHTEKLPDQAAWFTAQMAAAAPVYRNIVVLGHVPAWHGGGDYEFDDYVTQARALRNTFWPVMNNYADKVRFYGCGHEHFLSITPKLKMNYDPGQSLAINDRRWTADSTDGVRQIGAGPWAGIRSSLDPVDMAEVSLIDGSDKFAAAMGYDSSGDAVETHGTGLTNTSKETWHVWICEFSATNFNARAVSKTGADFYEIDETL